MYVLELMLEELGSQAPQITDDAEAQFMAFFAEKTIGMIRGEVL
jgi:hypothetical protein